MTVENIRRENIKYWADKLGRKVLAKRAGYDDTIYINHLVNGNGSFGGRTARKLEKALELYEGNFDTLHDYLNSVEDSKTTDYKSDAAHRIAVKIPLISFAQVSERCGPVDPYELSDVERYINSQLDHSDSAFCVKITGDSMDDGTRDGYPDGCLAQFEPNKKPLHGDDVLVRMSDGTTAFKQLQITAQGSYLVDLNPDFPNRITEMQDDAIICAVCTGYIVEKRRHR